MFQQSAPLMSIEGESVDQLTGLNARRPGREMLREVAHLEDAITPTGVLEVHQAGDLAVPDMVRQVAIGSTQHWVVINHDDLFEL